MKFKFSITDLITLVLSAALLVGSFTFFAACGAKDDGSFMNCHNAQIMLTALGALLTAQSLAAFIVPDRRVKAGLNLATTLTAVVTALVPQTLIPLCMMPDMHCRSVTQPMAMLFASLVAVAALVSAVLNLKRKES